MDFEPLRGRLVEDLQSKGHLKSLFMQNEAPQVTLLRLNDRVWQREGERERERKEA